MKKLIVLFLMGPFLSVHATTEPLTEPLVVEKEESRNPLGCRNIGFQYDMNVLKLKPVTYDEKQSLYFVFNKSLRPVHLYQMLSEQSGTRTIPLNHSIGARQWSALATSDDEMKYICTIDEANSKYGKIVSCKDNVRVCEYARVRFGLNNRGNFWFVGSNTRGGAVSQVVHYGIIPQ